MEDFNFSVDNILSQEEAEEMFRDQETQEPEEEKKKPVEEEKDKPADDEGQDPSQEKVGEEEDNDDGNDAIDPDDDGSSPNTFSSIAKALGVDGILTGFSEKELEEANTPEALAELFEKEIQNRMDEKQKRIDQALGNGVAPDLVRQYEGNIEWLNSVSEEALSAEGEEGENLRRYIMYNDLMRRGYSEDRAKRELEKSFTAGSDVDDAKDSLEALKSSYMKEYQKLQDDAKARAEEYRANQKKQSEEFRRMVLEDEIKIGATKLDKRTAQKVYDAVTKPVYKDPDTGKLLTAVQKYQKENPLEFTKQLGMWFVLTEGGKNMDGFTKEQLRQEKNKGIRELERKINSSSINPDGSLKYASGRSSDSDSLLKGDWDVMM